MVSVGQQLIEVRLVDVALIGRALVSIGLNGVVLVQHVPLDPHVVLSSLVSVVILLRQIHSIGYLHDSCFLNIGRFAKEELEWIPLLV